MQKEILSFSKMHVEGDQVITATHDELLMKDGRVLKDTMSGLWNVTLGYSNNNIKQSMMHQLVKLPYASNFLVIIVQQLKNMLKKFVKEQI